VAICAGTLIAHAATADELAAERAYRAGADLDHRGDCAGAQAQYAAALALLEKTRAAGSDPRMMSTLFNLAFAEHCTGAERAAYDHLNRVLADLERAPRAVVPANQLILAYDLLGKITHELALWNEEIAALARAASVFATDPGRIRLT
jgi:tetratricopeptide (TPR) repeat protein